LLFQPRGAIFCSSRLVPSTANHVSQSRCSVTVLFTWQIRHTPPCLLVPKPSSEVGGSTARCYTALLLRQISRSPASTSANSTS
ncbi:hypothetical protein CLOP_g20790, partial [Closterium sp. NIES-67]